MTSPMTPYIPPHLMQFSQPFHQVQAQQLHANS